MAAIRTRSNSSRALWAVGLAVILSLRLLGSTGYMPGFEQGALTVVACPGADDNAPLAIGTANHHHHHGKGTHKHPSCPYASAGALGSLVADLAVFAAAFVFGVTLATGRAFTFLERHRTRERPPLRGPPLLA